MAREAGEGAVSFELKAAPCPHSGNLLGLHHLTFQLLCRIHLCNRYFLFLKKTTTVSQITYLELESDPELYYLIK